MLWSVRDFIRKLWLISEFVRNLCLISEFVHLLTGHLGHAVVLLVEALRYKSEGHGFDSRWCHWNLSLTILPATLLPSG
jgi:hypothetical protein